MCSGYPAEPSPAISRRKFLKLGGAGIAGAAVLGMTGNARVLAQEASLSSEFEAASQKHRVPVELLLAMGYVNSRWEMPPPSSGEFEPGDIHGSSAFGVAGLSEDPRNDTLARASSLIGVSEADLKTDRAANIEGGAAVLAALAGDRRPSDINGWFDEVAEFGGGTLYAQQVYDVLQDGASARVGSERLTLEAQERAVEPRSLQVSRAAGQYPGSEFYPASTSNYSNASRPGSNTINKVIIHTMQGSWSSAINWFQDSRAGASCHYNVRSSDGFIGQSVREEDIAWHAGYWSYNQTSVGIEHEGFISDPNRWYTDAMYRSSARLCAYLCKKYGIPVDRSHIIGHVEVPGCPGYGGGGNCHTDPGTGWDWSRYISLVKSYLGSAPTDESAGGSRPDLPRSKNRYSQVVDNTTPGRFSAAQGVWVSSSWNTARYGGSYRAVEEPTAYQRPARFKIKVPKSGAYQVFAWWPSHSAYNPEATFLIKAKGAWRKKTVSQRRSGGRWVSLGTYQMRKGDRWGISLLSKSPRPGKIIADAVGIVER